jgi:serine/threonine protein phosphatase 1
MRSYAVGDIHGHLDKLEAAHALIDRDRRECGDDLAPVVHVGDLVDRGPNSRAVIDFLIAGQQANAPWVVLKGNHDRMFTGFMRDPDNHDPGLRPELHWVDPRLGGGMTLASYGVEGAGERMLFDLHEEARAKVPADHLTYLNGLPTYFLHGEILFVHAGVRPGVGLRDQDENDLMWIRKDFLEDRRDHGVLIVHGHTPVEAVQHHGNRLNIDTGAGYGKDLSTVVIEGRTVWQLTQNGRVEIAPPV